MQVRPLSDAVSGNAFKRRLDDLILSVGTSDFESALFTAARDATGCEHLTAFAINDDGTPTMLLAAAAGYTEVARAAGETYVSRFWNADPINKLAIHQSVDGFGIIARPTGPELAAASSFRKDCYSTSTWSRAGSRMIDRVSVFKRARDRTIKISFHRDRSVGLFGDAEIDNIEGATDFLTALISRHARWTDEIKDTSAPGVSYVDAVLLAAPELSLREAQVCAGIVQGMTSEGIALDLNISINTVRTYRKRAYSRLNISSQNELMKLVLPFAPEPSRQVYLPPRLVA